MKVIVVDDEPLALEMALSKLKSIELVTEILGFSDPDAALAHLAEDSADVAFLDIEMFGLNGIELAKLLKDACPTISVVFLTGYSEYAYEAFRVRASGYILKPASRDDFLRELQSIGVKAIQPSAKRVRAQTFGNFELFVDDVPVKFQRSKSKEALAYLIDRRGSGVTMPELIAVLWEDKENDRSARSMLHNVLSDLSASLKAVGVGDLIDKSRNRISVSTDAIDCDYYSFLAGDVRAINSYAGEYMNAYSWAEFTTGMLTASKQA